MADLFYGSKEYNRKVKEGKILSQAKKGYQEERRKEDIQKIKKGFEKSKNISSGISGFNINEKKIFSGGQEVKTGTIKRFASSGNSELHAKGSFEDVKKRFGRFE